MHMRRTCLRVPQSIIQRAVHRELRSLYARCTIMSRYLLLIAMKQQQQLPRILSDFVGTFYPTLFLLPYLCTVVFIVSVTKR